MQDARRVQSHWTVLSCVHPHRCASCSSTLDFPVLLVVHSDYFSLLVCFTVQVPSGLHLEYFITRSPGTVCEGQVTSETHIGQDNNIKVQFTTCTQTAPEPPRLFLDAYQSTPPSNVCGLPCKSSTLWYRSGPWSPAIAHVISLGTTNCFTPAGGGPDPNECHVIADALLYDSQNIGP